MKLQQVTDAFKSRFGSVPRLFFSPGRINLIGEHIDYNAGFVMPAAINKGIWFAIAANHSNRVRLYSVDFSEAFETTLDNVHPVEGWPDYLLGVVDQAIKNNLSISGFDCVFGGNLPVGAGLSSSAAVECGTLYALSEVFLLQLDRRTIALLAQKAEHTFPKVMCGIMDQYASIMGKENHVLLLDCLTVQHEYLPLRLDQYTLVLINTLVHHSLADGAYNKRRQQCQEGFALLQQYLPQAHTFRDIASQQVKELKHIFEPVIYNRCLFVTEEIERTQQAAALLRKGDLKAFGQLMFAAHEGLSKLYEVSCPELDFLADKAQQLPAVIGSRMMGGGFGGCTLNLMESANWQATAEEIQAQYKQQFGIDAEVYEVGTSDGTHEVALS